MGDKVRLRVPLMEAGLEAAQKVFTSRGRSLTSGNDSIPRSLIPNEKELLVNIFGSSINLDVVELAYTKIAKDGRAYTLGSTIHIPEHMPKGGTFDAGTLVHEMTHVWQYQTQGTAYLSDSIFHQLTQGTGAYDVDTMPGKAFRDYAAEQQAIIVERYYRDYPEGWRSNPDVVRMIAEIKRARPLSSTQIQQETWYGPNIRQFDTPDSDSNTAKTVPLFRIEF
jgi:hypothetical protein